MEAQVVVHLAGGSEAIFRGERCQGEVLRFAEAHCCVDDDLTKVADVLAELRRLTAYRFEAQDFIERTLTMLELNWPAVEALAEALVDEGRIEGDEVEWIIDRSLRFFRTSGEHVKGP